MPEYAMISMPIPVLRRTAGLLALPYERVTQFILKTELEAQRDLPLGERPHQFIITEYSERPQLVTLGWYVNLGGTGEQT